MTLPRQPHRRRWLAFCFKLALTAPLAALVARHIDWTEMSAAFGDVDARLVAAAFLIYLASQVISARRWAALARPIGLHASDGRFLRLYFEGAFFNLCLPGAIGGDVVKAYRLAADPAGRVLAGCTVLADRVTGVIALFAIGLLAWLHTCYPLNSAQGLGAAAGALLAAVAVAAMSRAALVRFSPAIARLPMLGELASRLRPYVDRQYVLAGAVGWSFLVQGMNVAAVWCLGRSMGLRIPAVAYLVAVPAVSILTILPVSIAGIGVREGSLAMLLAPYGVQHELAVTLGILWFAAGLVCGLAGGAVYLFARAKAGHGAPGMAHGAASSRSAARAVAAGSLDSTQQRAA